MDSIGEITYRREFYICWTYLYEMLFWAAEVQGLIIFQFLIYSCWFFFDGHLVEQNEGTPH